MATEHAADRCSARITHDGNTFIYAHEKIRPLRDWMVIEPLPVAHSSILVVLEDMKPTRGLVKAIGPGCYPKKYDHPDKHKRTKMWDSKHFLPTQIKVGDIVDLGGREIKGYAFQSFLWGDKPHLMCREPDVCGVEIR